jgi:hypothetical protein
MEASLRGRLAVDQLARRSAEAHPHATPQWLGVGLSGTRSGTRNRPTRPGESGPCRQDKPFVPSFDDSSQWPHRGDIRSHRARFVRRKSLTTRQVSSWFRAAGDRRSVKDISTSHVVGDRDVCPRQAPVVAVADGQYFEMLRRLCTTRPAVLQARTTTTIFPLASFERYTPARIRRTVGHQGPASRARCRRDAWSRSASRSGVKPAV